MSDATLTLENIFAQLQKGVSSLVEENLRLARELEAPRQDESMLDTTDHNATREFVEEYVQRWYSDDDLAYLMRDQDSYIRDAISNSDADTLCEEFGDDETLVEALRRRGSLTEDEALLDAVTEAYRTLTSIGGTALEDVLHQLEAAADSLRRWA